MRWLLRASMALNAVLGLALARRLRRRALIRAGRYPIPEHDFAALARQTFSRPEPGGIILVGDSQVAHAPWLEMLTPYRNRGLSGAKIADVGSWLDEVLGAQPAHLLLMVGSNDVHFAVPRAQSIAAARALFGTLAQRGSCPVTVVSVPPLLADRRAARSLNTALAELAAEHGFGWVDIGPALAGTDWTEDGIHLNAAAYRAIAPVVAAALGSPAN